MGINKGKPNTNVIIEYDDYAIIKTIKGDEILIDLQDVELLKIRTWYVRDNKYAVTQDVNTKKNIYIHRLIMGAQKGDVIDHINKNKLDNRRCNLRFCTYRQNNLNLKRHPSISGCIGVIWCKKSKKWKAHINDNYKSINLGYFTDLNEAIAARKEAEKQYHDKEFWNPY